MRAFRIADAESQRAERAIGAGVGCHRRSASRPGRTKAKLRPPSHGRCPGLFGQDRRTGCRPSAKDVSARRRAGRRAGRFPPCGPARWRRRDRRLRKSVSGSWTFRPRRSISASADGPDRSWRRCRSICSRDQPSPRSRTSWLSQIFSNSVRGTINYPLRNAGAARSTRPRRNDETYPPRLRRAAPPA